MLQTVCLFIHLGGVKDLERWWRGAFGTFMKSRPNFNTENDWVEFGIGWGVAANHLPVCKWVYTVHRVHGTHGTWWMGCMVHRVHSAWCAETIWCMECKMECTECMGCTVCIVHGVHDVYRVHGPSQWMGQLGQRLEGTSLVQPTPLLNF